jgi:putative membrane protein
MKKETETRINKDLILREKLAIERTAMANDRTFLSFVRTSLYFAIAGITVNSLLNLSYGWFIEILFLLLSLLVLAVGIVKYYSQKKKLNENKKHVGDYKLEWEDDDA